MTSPRLLTHLRLLAATVAVLLVTGCSSAVEEASSSGTGDPVDGGTLEVAAATDLIPASVFGQSSDGGNTLIGLVYDSLVEYPHDSLEAQPSLATSWKIAEDGRSITLQLRDDVKFHDGKPFTSEDVKFSVETFADPVWAVQLQRTAAAVTGFDTSEPHEITLEFAHPMSNILDLLDIMPILDEDTFDEVKGGTGYNGTGAFEFTGWKPNASLTFSRNDDYWKGAPHLDGVDVNIVPDPQAQVAGLRSGQYDVALNVTPRDTETLSEDARFTVHDFEGATFQTYVGFNLDNPELQDVRLRQAVAHAVDRERILEEVFRGAGIAQNLSWSPDSPAYDEEAALHYDHDVEQARKLAGQAGDVPTLPLQYPAGDPVYESVAQVVQSDLGEAGIEVDLKPTEYAQMYKQLVAASYEGMWIFGHTYAQYNPATLTVSAYPFNAAHNASNFKDKEYLAASDASWKVADGDSAEARKRYAEVNRHLIEDLWLTDLATFYPRLPSTSAVHGVGYSKRTELILNDAWKDE